MSSISRRIKIATIWSKKFEKTVRFGQKKFEKTVRFGQKKFEKTVR